MREAVAECRCWVGWRLTADGKADSRRNDGYADNITPVVGPKHTDEKPLQGSHSGARHPVGDARGSSDCPSWHPNFSFKPEGSFSMDISLIQLQLKRTTRGSFLIGVLMLWQGMQCLAAPFHILPPETLGDGIVLFASSEHSLPTDGWSVLRCQKDRCEVAPIALILETTSKSEDLSMVQVRSTGSPMEGNGKFIALLHGISAQRAVRPAFRPSTPRQAKDAELGTIGVWVSSNAEPPFDLYRVMPRSPRVVDEESEISLNIETADRMQSVGSIPVQFFFGSPKTRDLLRFSGDLDGDGRLDFITRIPVGGGTAQTQSGFNFSLWLSSLAKSMEVLGLAASTTATVVVLDEEE